MPRVIIPNTHIEETFLRPIVLKIINDIKDITGMDDKYITNPDNHVKIYYPSDSEKIIQPGAALSEQFLNNRLASDEKVIVTVTEKLHKENVLCNQVNQRDGRPIFLDRKLEFGMYPIYKNTEVNINFTIRFPNRELSRKWLNFINNKIEQYKQAHIHDLAYGYNIPTVCLFVLREIHRLREETKGYDEDLSTYFSNNCSQNITKVTNQAGNNPIYAVAETQTRILGFFDFDIPPDKGNKENDTEATTVEFSYIIRIDKPTDILLIYPVSVHNQILDDKYQILDHPLTFNDRELVYNQRAGIYKYFEAMNAQILQSNKREYTIPYFDDFYTIHNIKCLQSIFTCLIQLTQEDKDVLVNLTDMGDYDIHPVILNFLKKEITWLTRPFESVFNITMYVSNEIMDPRTISIDNALNIYNEIQLDYRKVYHIRFSVVTDLNLLTPEALERLRKDKDVLRLILDLINDKNKNIPLNGIGKDKQYVPKKELDKFINANLNPDNIMFMKTVQTLGIIALRKGV